MLQRLADAGVIDRRALLAHCVDVDGSELELIDASGATVVHNARSNMNNRVGHAPVGSFARLALGTDGIDGDMFAESCAAFWRAREADPAVGPGWLLAAIAGSARFAGACFDEPLLGRIEAGAPADLVVLDYDPPTPLEADNLGGHWVFGFTSRLVRDVLVAGEVVVRDRMLARVGRARDPGARARAGGTPVGARRANAGTSVRTGRRRVMAVSSEGRVALYLQDKHPLREAIGYARYAEERGFEAVWQAESRLVREATVPMAAYAAATDRIEIGSGVVNCWTRNVGLLAATFVTLDDLGPGRIKLGIGAWWDPLAQKVGIERRRPLTVMREVVDATRRLLAMENVTFEGEHVHLDGVEIDVVHGDRSPRHVPIYIGATGMKMMELAGEIGDGVLLNYLVGPRYNASGDGASGRRSRACRPPGGGHRPSAARGLFARRAIGRWPWIARASWSPSTWGSSRTSGRRAASTRDCWSGSGRC